MSSISPSTSSPDLEYSLTAAIDLDFDVMFQLSAQIIAGRGAAAMAAEVGNRSTSTIADVTLSPRYEPSGTSVTYVGSENAIRELQLALEAEELVMETPNGQIVIRTNLSYPELENNRQRANLHTRVAHTYPFSKYKRENFRRNHDLIFYTIDHNQVI